MMKLLQKISRYLPTCNIRNAPGVAAILRRPAFGFSLFPVISAASAFGLMYSSQAQEALSVAVSAGPNHSLLLKNDGTVWGSGANTIGQLGDGTSGYSDYWRTPKPMPGVTGVQAIAAGTNFSLMVQSGGQVLACGSNSNGQLGDGTTTDRSSPVQISTLTGVASVSAGYDHSLFLKTDGTVWACGNNPYGQLGDGTTVTRKNPVFVMSGVKAVSAGAHFSLFLKTDGSVLACGYNDHGALGVGSTPRVYQPVLVMTDVAAVSGGQKHCLFLKNDGSVWASGINVDGQLGDGTTTKRDTPVRVPNMDEVKMISASKGWHSLFLKTDGSVWSCGGNSSGELGDGTTTKRITPVRILNGAVSIATGSGKSFFVRSDGSVWGCGSNGYYDLGNDTVPFGSKVPIKVQNSGNNTAPSMTGLPDHSLSFGTSNYVLQEFTLEDADTSTTQLEVSVQSSNPILVPQENMVFSNQDTAGKNRYIEVRPAQGVAGSTLITVTVTDGMYSASQSFTLTVTPPKSNNALLKSLALTGVRLSPGFSPNTAAYTASVASTVSSVSITPTSDQAEAIIRVNGVAVASGKPLAGIALKAGSNLMKIEVTAEDRLTVKNYTVTINRAKSSDARLSGLALSTGKLSPTFSKTVLSYKVSVAKSVSSIKLKPTASHAGAVIRINGKIVKSGAISTALSLAAGSNTLKVAVTAEDGSLSTYKVVVTRGSLTTKISALAAIVDSSPAKAASGTRNWTTKQKLNGFTYRQLTVEYPAGSPAPRVEVSGDLLHWSSGPRHTTVIAESPGRLTVRDNTPLAPGVKRYIRIKNSAKPNSAMPF